MFSALFSFLGGSAFRMIWGEISHYINAKQSHQFELDRLKLQGDLDAAQAEREAAAIRLQAELGVKVIEAQRDSATAQSETDAWLTAVRYTGAKVGIGWVDAWNGAIRPTLATMAILVIVGEVYTSGFHLSPWHQDLVGAILGLYVADRTLTKRGK